MAQLENSCRSSTACQFGMSVPLIRIDCRSWMVVHPSVLVRRDRVGTVFILHACSIGIAFTPTAAQSRDQPPHHARPESSTQSRLQPQAAQTRLSTRAGQTSRFQRAAMRFRGWQQGLRTVRLRCRRRLTAFHRQAPRQECRSALRPGPCEPQSREPALQHYLTGRHRARRPQATRQRIRMPQRG